MNCHKTTAKLIIHVHFHYWIVNFLYFESANNWNLIENFMRKSHALTQSKKNIYLSLSLIMEYNEYFASENLFVRSGDGNARAIPCNCSKHQNNLLIETETRPDFILYLLKWISRSILSWSQCIFLSKQCHRINMRIAKRLIFFVFRTSGEKVHPKREHCDHFKIETFPKQMGFPKQSWFEAKKNDLLIERLILCVLGSHKWIGFDLKKTKFP